MSGDSQRTGVALDSTTTNLPDLDAGSSTAFSLSEPLNSIAFGQFGVYPAAVEVLAVPNNGSAGRAAIQWTFLPWTPDPSAIAPTKLVWLLPLTTPPVRDANRAFINSSTTDAVTASGSLTAVADAGANRTVTWLVDPDTVDAINELAKQGDVAALNWLTTVRRDLATADVVGLGYGDPDLTALQAAGLTSDISAALQAGPPALRAALGRSATSDVSYPGGGAVNEATLDTLQATGQSAVILDADNYPTDEPSNYTPTGLGQIQTVGGSMQAILYDHELSQEAAATGSALALQDFLADSAMITAERPNDSRTIVVTPGRGWSPTAAYAQQIVGESAAVPWLSLTTLASLRTQPSDAQHRTLADYTSADQAAQLPASYLASVASTRTSLTNFVAILSDPSTTATPFGAALLRTESVAWRAEASTGQALLETVKRQLASQTGQVRILSHGTITLSGGSGRVPITIANGLNQTVRVRLSVTGHPAFRTTLSTPGLITIDANRKESLEIDATVKGAGLVTLDAQLTTPNGAPFGRRVQLQVRSSPYGRVGAAIIVFALIALAVLVVARVLRARRSGSVSS